MIIANSLYDVIFKYLLEDIDIAKEMLSTSDKHKLDFTGDTNEPVVQKILNRLQRAIADNEMRHKMDFEDEIERILEREAKKAATKAAAAAAAEKDLIIAEKDEVIAEKDEALAKKDAELEVLRQLVASMKKNNLE